MADIVRQSEQIANQIDFVNFEETMKRVSQENYERRSTITDPSKIRVREGKKGKTYAYITRTDAQEWLDKHYPIWSWEIDSNSFKEFAGFVQVSGTLKVIEPSTGAIRSICTYGSDEIEFKKDSNEPVSLTYAKNVDTDALKRAVFTLGGFKDVYTGIRGEERDTASEEDLEWFITNVIPAALKAGMTYDRIVHRLMAFREGIIEKEYIAKQLNLEV